MGLVAGLQQQRTEVDPIAPPHYWPLLSGGCAQRQDLRGWGVMPPLICRVAHQQWAMALLCWLIVCFVHVDDVVVLVYAVVMPVHAAGCVHVAVLGSCLALIGAAFVGHTVELVLC